MQKAKQLETLLVIVLGLIVAGWLTKSAVFPGIALAIGVSGLVIPAFARAIHWAWSGLSRLLGAISEKILLTIIYTLVLIPLSALAKLFGKFRPGKSLHNGSYFRERNHTYTKDDLENLW